VAVDVQDYLIFNNANASATFADGSSPPPRLQIGLGSVPPVGQRRDASFDNEVILHEYSHLVISRLVPMNSGLLCEGDQFTAIHEGTADFFSLSFLSHWADALNASYAWGAYFSYNRPYTDANGAPLNFDKNYYFGVRYYPYSLDFGKFPLTYGDIPAPRSYNSPVSPLKSSEPWECHGRGQIWAAALLEARKLIIEANPPLDESKYNTGNNTILKDVIDGLRCAPPSPTFLELRDSIILADRINYSGANVPKLWQAFAKRGMGFSAVGPHNNIISDGFVEAFDVYTVNGRSWDSSASPANIKSSPALGLDNTIYYTMMAYPATQNPGGFEGRLIAVNPDGTTKWQFLHPMATITYDSSFEATPCVGRDGTVYVGSNDGFLFAVRPNGTLKWSRSFGAMVKLRSPTLSDEGYLYCPADNVGSTGYGLVVLNASSGATLSSYLPALGVTATAIIDDDGYLYLGTAAGQIHCWAQTGGTLTPRSGWPKSVISGHGGIATSVTSGPDKTIHAVTSLGYLYAWVPSVLANTPKAGWGFRPSGVTSASFSPIVSGAGDVYVSLGDGYLYAYASSGAYSWAKQLGSGQGGNISLGLDGSMYVGLGNNKLVCVGSDGSGLWTNSLSGPILGAPLFGPDGTLYSGTGCGILHALPGGSYSAFGLSPDSAPWPTAKGNNHRTGDNRPFSVGLVDATLEPGFCNDMRWPQ
jgi:hypothetical protein